MNKTFILGKSTLKIGQRTLVMGILNLTPDSFSDGGKFVELDTALKHAKQLQRDGADIIDIGGESTRPGATPLSLEEELDRVIPVVKRISQEIEIPLSIDTYKSEVAKKAIEAGAHIINDVWGAKRDPNMAKVAADCNVPVILMHNKNKIQYSSFLKDVLHELKESIQIAIGAGVPKEHILIDPGIGFAKEYHHNLELMKNLDQLVDLGYPVVLGTSRKKFIGMTLDLPVEEREEGTAATIAWGIMKGCHIVRVHDVKKAVRVSRMIDAIRNFQ